MTVSDLGFTLDRTYAATPERVYAHFTDPELLASWFCPNPDLPTSCELDVRPAGEWRVVMGEWIVGGPGGEAVVTDQQNSESPGSESAPATAPGGKVARVADIPVGSGRHADRDGCL